MQHSNELGLHTDLVRLYGRAGLVAELMRAGEPLVLVTGDSGVGKSALVTAALEEGQAHGQVTSLTPRRLVHRPGALQQALIDQLAVVTASLLAGTSLAERAGRVIVGAAREIARDRGRDLALVIGKELLSIVKNRLGIDGQALGDYVSRLVTEQEQNLLARLRAAADPDALSALVSFAAEIVDLADGAPVVLGIDDADRLSDPDLRQLADLIAALPAGVLVRAGHLTAPTTDLGRIRLLRDAGARELQVTGLDVPAIRQWLEAERLDTRTAARVHRLTGGYPVFIDDVLRVLASSGSLSDIEPNELFASNTRETMHRLEVSIARAARLLSPYVDPPPIERILAIVGVDQATWTVMRDRLVQRRIFATIVNGQPWFHELRRQAVWTGLDRAERSAAADQALVDLQDWFDQTENPEALVAMALIAKDGQLARSDPMASYSLDADVEAVAVASSVLEIAEPVADDPYSEMPVVMGDSLLGYAQRTFHVSGNLLEALRKLDDHNLLIVASNQYASVVIPRFTKLPAMLMAGRAGAELGRLPIPRLASNVFQTVITPRIGQFEDARYGLGEPTIANLCGNPPILQPGSARHPPAVLARGLVAGQPFYLATTFADTARRGNAAAQLRGLVEPFLTDRVAINDVLEFPLTRVPAKRFLRAISRMINRRLNPVSPRLSAETPVDLPEAINRRADTLRLVRAQCSGIERYALELEEPIRLIFAKEGDTWIVAEVLGGEDGFVELATFPGPPISVPDPYERYLLREQLGLSWNQRLRRVEHHWGGATLNDPVVEMLVALSKKAEAFNRHQPRLEVPLQQSALQALLAEADRRCFDDALALHMLPLSTETHPPQPLTTLAVVCPDIPEYGWVEGTHAAASLVVMDATEGDDGLRLHVAAPTHRPGPPQLRQAFLSAFGVQLSDDGILTGLIPERRIRYATHGSAQSVLGNLLGYGQGDIRLRLPA
jgi:AAA ATPase domain